MTKRRAIFGFLIAMAGLAMAFWYAAAKAAISPDQLIQFLNQTIAFYHQTETQQQIATEPQEQVLAFDNRQIANQAVGFAFDFARAQEATAAAAPAGSNGGAAPQSGALQKMLANLDQQLQDTQTEADEDRRKLATATGAQHAQLESEISELQGEIALSQARRDAVDNMLQFVSGSATNTLDSDGLKAQIDALAAAVPGGASGSTSNAANTQSQPAAVTPTPAAPSGIWELSANLFTLTSRRRDINTMLQETNALEKTADQLRAPFIAQLQALSKNGDQVAAQADTANAATLAQEKQQLDALATQFKQISAAVIPLGKQRVLLDLYLKNLAAWQGYITDEYKSDLRDLAIRLILLAILLALLFGVFELWRRAVFRYVHDLRRRNQMLLIRKLALWVVFALIIAGTLAGRFGSFATFAGLLTAGVAVALQNVIVSVVGYFFLIGKFGIRIGDHVELSGTKGEVIEIGLVRFHLMEFGAGGTPTGRVVAFSNAVVFQSSAGLFRQIPGASFAWHEVTLTIPREADVGAVKKDLLAAVNVVLADHQEHLKQVSGELERRGILFSERRLQPTIELHLAADGITATIRYPVDLQHASDIDARVSHELLTVLERDLKKPVPPGDIRKQEATPQSAD